VNFKPWKTKFDTLVKIYCSTSFAEVKNCLSKIQQFDEQLAFNKSKSPRFTSECLHDKKTLSVQTFPHHTFIDPAPVNLNFCTRIARLHVLSFLATQNLKCTRLLIWHVKDTAQVILKSIKTEFGVNLAAGDIEFKEIDLSNPCQITNSSVFAKHSICTRNSLKQANMSVEDQANLTNFIRFFVLDAYGGIFSEPNIIYLKSTRVLWNETFASRANFKGFISTDVIGMSVEKSDLISKMYSVILEETYGLRELIAAFAPESVSRWLAQLSNRPLFEINNSIKLYHR
jgi:hypothetical protein